MKVEESIVGGKNVGVCSTAEVAVLRGNMQLLFNEASGHDSRVTWSTRYSTPWAHFIVVPMANIEEEPTISSYSNR